MKNIALAFLVFISAFSYGQTIDSGVNMFIKYRKLILKSTQKYNVRSVKRSDSLVTFYCDSVSFKLSLQDISKIKNKNFRRAEKNNRALNEIRIAYKQSIDSFSIDSMSCEVESLILNDALSIGKVKEVTFKGKEIKSFKCALYATSNKGKPICYVFIDNHNIEFWAYSPIRCWGPIFR